MNPDSATMYPGLTVTNAAPPADENATNDAPPDYTASFRLINQLIQIAVLQPTDN
jgi:hypothetical protein